MRALARLVALLLAAGVLAVALPVRAAEPAAKELFAVIVTRHGVRSITSTPKNYAWAPWAPVRPGYLSAHGYRLISYMGRFYRGYFGERAGFDCRTHGAYVYADVDERTLETARALVEGLCGAPTALPILHERDTSLDDPLFNATAWVASHGKLDVAASRAAVAAAAPAPPSAIVSDHAADFAALQAMLDARCLPGYGCASVTDGASGIGAHEGLAELGGPLKVASGYAEDTFLEYAECRPLAAMGADNEVEFVERLQAAMRLHVLAYDVNARNAYNPLVRGGNLFAHVVALLQQKAGIAHPVTAVPSLGGDSLAIFSGHDTQLGALGGILDAHWHFGDGLVDDDMPPGSALLFELLRTPGGSYAVRVRFAFEELAQFRSASPVPGGIATVPVRLLGCTSDACDVPLSRLADLATRLRQRGFVDARWAAPSDAVVPLAPLADPSWSACAS